MRRRSLRTTALSLLVFTVGVLGALEVGTAHFGRMRQEEEHHRHTAELVAGHVANAIETAETIGTIQRLVMAHGGDRSIRDIVVVAGEPLQVVAATRGDWLGVPLANLDAPHLVADLEEAYRSQAPTLARHEADETYGLALPLRLNLPEVRPGLLSHGAVLVHLDEHSLHLATERQLYWTILAMVGGLLLLGAATLWLYQRHVLRPLEELGRVASAGPAPGSHEAWNRLFEGAPVEIGNLARALHLTLDGLERANHALGIQKQALDQHAIVSAADLGGNITYVNDRLCQVSGYSREELLGRNHRVLKSDHHPPAFYRELWGKIRAGQPWHGELCNRKKSGELYWVDTTIVPMVDPAGKIIEYVSIRTDVTEHRRTQVALEHARDESEAANLAKGEFLATMSHEIRTPMNGVIGCARLLEATPLNDEQRQWVQTIGSSGRALLEILNGVLDLSKIEAGKVELELRPLDLRATLEDLVALFRPRADEKGLALRSELAATLPSRLQGDETRLRQVLGNFIGNAIKFTEKGEVVLRAAPLGDGTTGPWIRFEVRDTGEGIPPEALKRLFTRFSQADSSTTRRFGGTGLGLAISRGLVEVMGGRIGVDSTPGLGSMFWAELPLVVVDQPPTVIATSDLPVPPPLKVLVAEDNRVNQMVVGAMLSRLGSTPHFAANGQEAVRMVASGAFDLVLMDCQMPEMDGFTAAREIRRREGGTAEHPIPIVALTANATSKDREACIAAGMNDFLTKPIQPALLRQAIHRWARSP